ncbi:MAG: hypothetical protein HRU15_01360 [Planctomycetes bacterium]|nr:hypothetical protein [Planctomycetota bacterium]
MTIIPNNAVRIGIAADIPDNWASEFGALLHTELSFEAKGWLQDRILGLGHGVELAHIRSQLVENPTMAAYMASDIKDESQTWLWIVVFIPEGNASRHLGWMAHLAACIRDVESRIHLRSSEDVETLHAELEKMLEVRTHRLQRSTVSSADHKAVELGAAPAAENRMVVAILKEPEYVDKLLELFVEHDVRGSTILEARGMAEHLAAHMSLFAGFKSAFRAVGHSQVILTLVPTDRTGEVLEMVRIAAGGMETPGSGIAFAIDVPRVIGLSKPDSTL